MSIIWRPVGTTQYERMNDRPQFTSTKTKGVQVCYANSEFAKRGRKQFLKWFREGNHERIEKELSKHLKRADSQFPSATREYSRGFVEAAKEKL